MSIDPIRVANLDGRLVLLVGNAPDGLGLAVDVAAASKGRLGPDPMAAYQDWPGFLHWATSADLNLEPIAVDPALLGPPVPQPRQVFAAGMNYARVQRRVAWRTSTCRPSSRSSPPA